MSECNKIGLYSVVLILASAVMLLADEFRFERGADWRTWTFPEGTLVFGDTGAISLSQIKKDINAVTNAQEFLHEVKSSKRPRPGGVHVVGSSPETGDNIIDGRKDTWWSPNSADVLEDWFIEVDLGRMVLAKKVRLTFADTLGVKPFRQFSLYINDGVRSVASKDVFKFSRVGRPTEPNSERVVEYELETIWGGASTGENLVTGDTLDYMMTQYVRFVAEEHQPGAALALIEVETVGDNALLGTVQRGGGVRGGADLGNLEGIVDGDKNTGWTISGTADWIDEGHWFEVDMGATYWIDKAFFHISRTRQIMGNFEITTSDGTQATGLTSERVRSNLDFLHMSLVDNTPSPPRRVFEFNFPPRKVRYTFFRRMNLDKCSQCLLTTLTDFLLFGEGYLAEVVMESDFIDLGGTKSIRKLSWEADLPSGTFIEIRSQTGDEFIFENKFYNKNGIEISENQWNKLPKSQKREIEVLQRRGSDWSGWSQVYNYPQEIFLSPSPRSYVQLQVKIGNHDPLVTPTLRNVVLHFDNPLISGGGTSRILPREAAFDSLQTFRYVLSPTFRSGDQGFNRVSIRTPFPVEDVEVKVGANEVVPTAVAMVGDLLQVDLPALVRRDSVEVIFDTRIHANATPFESWIRVVGEDMQQGVQPEAQHAATVFVPSVADEGLLIRQVEVASLVSANADGVNDEGAINFVLAKVEDAVPEVSIYDLSGRQVRVVRRGANGYSWDGRDDSGRLLPPGAYLCQIRLTADVGEERQHRIVNLVY